MSEIIRVNITSTRGNQPYEPRFLSIDGGRIIGCDFSNTLGYYLGYCSKELYEDRVAPIKEAMKRYNDTVAFLWSIDGFKGYFADHNSSLTKKEIESEFGSLVAEKALSLPCPKSFYPDLIVRDDSFMLKDAGYNGEISFNSKKYILGLTGCAEDYPSEIDGRICFWNWDEYETDYALGFATYVETSLPKGVHIEKDVFVDFDCYDQWRGNRLPIVEVIDKIFAEIEGRGYIKKYKLLANNNAPIWKYYTGTADNSVGLYLCDKKAFKDKLLVSRINALLRACSIDYDENDRPKYGALVNPLTEQIDISLRYFYLQNGEDITYISKEPGTIGGHYKLKIYGKLDCPSAARYLAKGRYKNHRVFFADEKTAIEAGYRPCAKCMPNEYKKWVSTNKKSGQ